MADQLPTYKKSVPIEVTPQADIDSSAQMLINSFKQFSNDVTEVATTLNKQVAEERRAIIKNNISTTYQQFAQSAILENDKKKGLDDYNIKANAYSQQLLAETDRFNKDYTKNLLDYYATAHAQPIVTEVQKQNQRVQQVDFVERNARATDDVINAINNSNPALGENQYDAALSLAAQQTKGMEQATVQGNMDRNTFGHAYTELRKKYKSEILLNQYKNAVNDGKGRDWLASFDKTNIEGLDQADKENIHAQIVKINRDHLAEAGLSLSGLNQQMKDEYKGIEETGRLPNADLTNIVNQVIPEKAKQFELQKRIAMRLYNIKQATATMNPSKTENYLNSLLPKPGAKTDLPEPIYRELYNRAVVAVNKQRQEILADPMKFVQKQPFIQATANNYQISADVNAVGEHKNSSPVNSTVTPPFKSIIEYQQSIGLSLTGKGNQSIRLMTNAEANRRVIQIEQSTARQKIDYMNRLNKDFGGGTAYQLAIRQLVNAGMPSQYALLANANPDSQESQDIGNAFAIPPKTLAADLKSKDESGFKALQASVASQVYTGTGAVNSKFQSYIQSTNSYAGNKSIQYLDGIKSTVEQLASYYLVTGKSTNNNDAINRAQSVIADRYNYTNLDNNTIRVPQQYTPSAIAQYAAKQEIRVKTFPFVLNTRDPKSARELVDKGHWANDPVDHGLVWVDFNGVVWKDKNEQPLSFSFDDAQYGPHLHEMSNLDKYKGMVTAGNIDLNTRPHVQNKDGTYSTIRTITAGIDGNTVLLPTIGDDGRVMSNKEAVEHYKQTGKHLGIFKTESDANRFDEIMHKENGWVGSHNIWEGNK